MLDLHSHFLPGVDDGPRTLEESLDMLRQAAAGGTRTMVATPHNRDVWEKMSVDALRALLEEVREAASKQGIPLELLLGMENHLEPDLPQRVDDGTALTLAGTRAILVEMPFTQYPPYIDETLFALQVRGLTPVIAHPERNTDIQRRPEVLCTLVERGILLQITGDSITGGFGRVARATARTLLRRGLAHVIASDTHTPGAWRPPRLTPAVTRAAELIGQERARAMVDGIPRAILRGEEVVLPPVSHSLPRRLWPFGGR